jgi:hypothetical protein
MEVDRVNQNELRPINANGTFSGADILLTMLFPNSTPIVLGHATTITYSTFREVEDARSLGRIGVKGFSRGSRTVAGTIIFTVINRHWLNDFRDQVPYLHHNQIRLMRVDELPPFDLIITGANEYGEAATMMLYGVTFVDEGTTMSIENLYTEQQMTYKAHDIRLFDYGNGDKTSSQIFLDKTRLPTFEMPARRVLYTGGVNAPAVLDPIATSNSPPLIHDLDDARHPDLSPNLESEKDTTWTLQRTETLEVLSTDQSNYASRGESFRLLLSGNLNVSQVYITFDDGTAVYPSEAGAFSTPNVPITMRVKSKISLLYLNYEQTDKSYIYIKNFHQVSF